MAVGQELKGSASLIGDIKTQIDHALATLVSASDPPGLYEPVRYVLSNGGKRLRPALVLLTAQAFGADRSEALPAALAVEVFHNFTLVHDDIMDNAPERRGRPTVHVRWDDGTAILTGDYLLSLSYRLLADCRTAALAELLTAYHEMVRQLCEGQVMDAVFERREFVSTAEYLQMIDHKTGALLSACLKMGGLLGSAGADRIEALGGAGVSLGRAFQIKDDLLDLIADDSRWGKRRGGDLIQAKKTYLLTRALESDDRDLRDWFSGIVRDGGLEEDRLDEAQERLRSAGILSDAVSAIDSYSEEAAGRLQSLPQNEFTAALGRLVERLRERLH